MIKHITFKRLILLLIIIGIIKAIFLLKDDTWLMELCLNKKKDWNNLSFSGEITNKYIDYQNHKYKTIECFVLENEKIILLNWEITSIFDSLAVGDSLFKNSGELRLLRIRNSERKEFLIDPGC